MQLPLRGRCMRRSFARQELHFISTTALWYLVRTARNAVNHFFQHLELVTKLLTGGCMAKRAP